MKLSIHKIPKLNVSRGHLFYACKQNWMDTVAITAVLPDRFTD
jgi:hypothetical protein